MSELASVAALGILVLLPLFQINSCMEKDRELALEKARLDCIALAKDKKMCTTQVLFEEGVVVRSQSVMSVK